MSGKDTKNNYRASIDIGSNSLLLLCGGIGADKKIHERLNESSITGLGKQLDKNKTFLDSSMEESFSALANYKKLLSQVGVNAENTIVTATEASRVAKNAKDFFTRVKKELGFSVNIISGEGEAYYSALGVSLSEPQGKEDLTLMDVGGASTELIHIGRNPLVIKNTISLPMGSVRAVSWKEENLYEKNLEKIIKDELTHIKKFKTPKLLAIAGTMTTLAGMHLGLTDYDDKKVGGANMTLEQFSRLLTKYENTPGDELLRIFPFLGKRAHTVIIGGKLALRLAQEMGVKDFVVSTYGLRYGTLFEGGVKNEFILWRPA